MQSCVDDFSSCLFFLFSCWLAGVCRWDNEDIKSLDSGVLKQVNQAGQDLSTSGSKWVKLDI